MQLVFNIIVTQHDWAFVYRCDKARLGLGFGLGSMLGSGLGLVLRS